MNAAWLARSHNEPENEKKFQQLAVSHFQIAHTNNEISEDQVDIITYLIGEIKRRLGEFRKALDFFSKVDPAKFDDNLLQQQIELAKTCDHKMAWYPQIYPQSRATTML